MWITGEKQKQLNSPEDAERSTPSCCARGHASLSPRERRPPRPRGGLHSISPPYPVPGSRTLLQIVRSGAQEDADPEIDTASESDQLTDSILVEAKITSTHHVEWYLESFRHAFSRQSLTDSRWSSEQHDHLSIVRSCVQLVPQWRNVPAHRGILTPRPLPAMTSSKSSLNLTWDCTNARMSCFS